MKEAVGILAYGSVIGAPGEEIAAAIIRRIPGVRTPFNVEFARTSKRRGGAPTLVPVDHGGAPVTGVIFVLRLPESDAASCLWRREIHQVGSGRSYVAPKIKGADTVEIRRLGHFEGVDIVLYAHIPANIEPLTTGALASLAIGSVRKAERGRDGISYLIEAKRIGITTGLSAEYEADILRRTGCGDLHEALHKLRDAA
jgi:hypothetical protein